MIVRNNGKKYSKILHQKLKEIKYLKLQRLFFNWKLFLREREVLSKKYLLLKNLKNKHIGERCFIIATGPSLTYEDIQSLKNEVTFGMNSLCKIYEDIGWEPSYYGLQDPKVLNQIENDVYKIRKSIALFGDNIKLSKKLNCKWGYYPLNFLDHLFTNKTLTSSFSSDCYKEVFDGYTITYSLIQIACYMGFKEIYLLGCDCHYSDDVSKQHFVESGHFDPSYKSAGKRMISSYEAAKVYTDQNVVKVFNATRGGKLEVFPRVNLEEVLKADKVI